MLTQSEAQKGALSASTGEAWFVQSEPLNTSTAG